MSKLSDILICPYCNEGPLTANNVVENAFSCESCQLDFPEYMGVPCFGGFAREEFSSLIELSSIFSECVRGNNGLLVRKSVNAKYKIMIKDLLELALAPGDRQQKLNQIEANPEVGSGYMIRFKNLCWLLETIGEEDLEGKLILDCGAGDGYDATLLRHLGATIVALEINPFQAAGGYINVPEIPWIQGNTRYLPFPDLTFDIVFAGSALHHMVLLQESLTEMLRVLKTGGLFISHSDMFSGDSWTETKQIEHFSGNQAVLMGVNEQRPCLSQYLLPFRPYTDDSSVRVFSPIVRGLFPESDNLRELEDPLSDPDLVDKFGALNIRARKLRHVTSTKQRSANNEIMVSSLLDVMQDKMTYLTALTKLVPPELVDIRITTAAKENKCVLLLGWSATPGKGLRILGEAFLYLTRSFPKTCLELSPAFPQDDQPEISMKTKDKVISRIQLSNSGPVTICIDPENWDFADDGIQLIRIGHDFLLPPERKWINVKVNE